MKKAIYPGTFDPITRGHIDMVQRAVKGCEHLVVGVARSTPKNVWFSIEERVELVRDALAHLVHCASGGNDNFGFVPPDID